MLIPILYLKGISTVNSEEALAALLGKDAPGLSASTVARSKEGWTGEHERCRSAISRPGATPLYVGGRHPPAGAASRMRGSAFLSSLARRPKARRS